MSELDLNQIETIARNLRAVSDETYSAAVAVADVYNVTSAYDIGDYCIKSTLLYKCNTAIPSGEVWNSNHWDEICVSDELNEIRSSVIHVGTSAPSNPNVQLWLDTDEPGASVVNSVNGKNGTVVIDDMPITLLWTNASSSSSFVAQTVSIDLSDYCRIYIVFNPVAGSGTNTVNIAIKGIGGVLFGSSSGRLRIREVTAVTDSGVTFAAGVSISSYASTETNNSACVPLYIYGVKGVIMS